MNLAIDIGNSSCKAGVYTLNRKEYIIRQERPDDNLIKDIISRFPVKRAILSSVKKSDGPLTGSLENAGIPTLLLSFKTPLPFRLQYESPETLGADRIAAVAGAHDLFSSQNVLIIDAGTAVTYDMLSSANIYLGGNISPGLAMRFRALNEFTGNLPLVSRSDSFGNLGVNTTEAIRSGVQSGLVFEINDYIRTLKNNYHELKIIITGGDGEYLSGKVDQDHEFIPDLVVNGLNYILNYNA